MTPNNPNYQNKYKSNAQSAGKNTSGASFQENNSWTQNSALKGIDPQKLALLNTLAEQGKGKSPQELLPFFLSASQNKFQGLKFSPQEMETIIQVLKIGKSPGEIQKIEQMLQMIKLLR